MSDITIFHNPNCGTSRGTLELLREKGLKPKVIEYLKAGWTEPQLKDLFKQMGVSPREALRVRGTDAEARGLTDPGVSDEAIVKAMTENPILVERPIVVTAKGAALCRPKEKVLGLI
ncbi:arsenate reductase (glutaredoxin) [Phenylobacterium sp.]|uniref:arsenate reductase (glutaredoxin) n=1 Tax=Phenylobacterium sp. TaxID=1871053 RepID=UPI00263829B0|nr:arsenate reductase (glutaredoxin) [Phenylobacterium sp.]